MKSNRPQKNQWIEYNIYPEYKGVKAMAKAVLNNKNELSVKLLFTAPRGQYYGFLEDARTEAYNLYSKYYKIHI